MSASERIFDRFVKLDEARSRDKSGSGLGLAMTRWIMRMHQGDVLFEPGDVRGAVFSLNLRRSLVAGRGQVRNSILILSMAAIDGPSDFSKDQT